MADIFDRLSCVLPNPELGNDADHSQNGTVVGSDAFAGVGGVGSFVAGYVDSFVVGSFVVGGFVVGGSVVGGSVVGCFVVGGSVGGGSVVGGSVVGGAVVAVLAVYHPHQS